MGDRENERKKKLTEYVRKNLRKGYAIDSLKWALVNQGYSRLFIDEAIDKATKELAAEKSVVEERPAVKQEIIIEPEPEKKSWWKRMFGG